MDRAAFLSAFSQAARGFRYHENARGVGSFTLPTFESQPWIAHGFSARTGGVSAGHLASLNLSFTREEEPRQRTMENYRIFCAAENIPEESMVMDTYEHGTTVRRVDRADRGRGYTLPSLPFCDGLVTDDPLVTLMTGHADCMAFFFADPKRRCIGLAHAGWRGALSRIGAEVVRMMQESFQSDPRDILAGVGPSICPNCFEVDAALGGEFQNAFPETDCLLPGRRPGKAYVDLWQVAVCQFLEAGIVPGNISLMEVCTVEDGRLYSHRGDGGRTGGMTAYLRILGGA